MPNSRHPSASSELKSMQKRANPQSVHAIIILILCAAFLFYKYIVQNFPSVMASELMAAFHLQGVGLGMLSGVYFWTYLIIPLFVGVLVDQYGTRWITSVAILGCGMSMILFSQVTHLNWAIVARAVLGVGVSFATISYLKLAATWFDKKYYALLTSLLVASGMAGAVCGQMPLAWRVHQVGWRASLFEVGIIGVGLALCYLLIVRDGVAQEKTEGHSFSKEIMHILQKKYNWQLMGYSGLAFAPVVIFCGLWGTPFLHLAYHINTVQASALVSWVFVGLGLASPVYALIEPYFKDRCLLMMVSTVGSALMLTLVLYGYFMPIWLVGVCLFLFGFFLGAFPMVFVIGKEMNPIYLAGTVLSFINASDAFLDAVTEPLIGKILDILGQTNEFTLLGYQIALGILPIYQIIGASLLRGVRGALKTHASSQSQHNS